LNEALLCRPIGEHAKQLDLAGFTFGRTASDETALSTHADDRLESSECVADLGEPTESFIWWCVLHSDGAPCEQPEDPKADQRRDPKPGD